MRIFPAVVLALLLVAACQTQPEEAASPKPATDAASQAAVWDTVTVTGRLIDATCHSRDVPPSDCEGRYVAQGYPVGLRTGSDAGSVWMLIMVPQAVGDYLSTTARVTGVIRSEGVLIPHRMEVKNGATWTSVM